MNINELDYEHVILPTEDIVNKFRTEVISAPLCVYDIIEALDYSCSVLELNDDSQIPFKAEQYFEILCREMMKISDDSSTVNMSGSIIIKAWVRLTVALKQLYVRLSVVNPKLVDKRSDWYFGGLLSTNDIVLKRYIGG